MFLIIYTYKSFAVEMGCDPFYLKPSNTVRGVSVFYTKYISAQGGDELTPNYEKEKDNIVTQFWKLSSTRPTNLFVECVYENGYSIAKQIPKSTNTCKFIFTPNHKLPHPDITPSFSCYTDMSN